MRRPVCGVVRGDLDEGPGASRVAAPHRSILSPLLHSAAPSRGEAALLTVRAAFCPLPPQLNVLQSFGVSKLQELNLEQVRHRTGGCMGCGLVFSQPTRPVGTRAACFS